MIGAVQEIRVNGCACDGQTFPGPPLELRHGNDVYRLAVGKGGQLVYAETITLPSTGERPATQTIASDAPTGPEPPKKRRPWSIHPPLTCGERRAYLALLRRGATLTAAAKEIGIGYAIFLQERKWDKDFDPACRDVRAPRRRIRGVAA